MMYTSLFLGDVTVISSGFISLWSICFYEFLTIFEQILPGDYYFFLGTFSDGRRHHGWRCVAQCLKMAAPPAPATTLCTSGSYQPAQRSYRPARGSCRLTQGRTGQLKGRTGQLKRLRGTIHKYELILEGTLSMETDKLPNHFQKKHVLKVYKSKSFQTKYQIHKNPTGIISNTKHQFYRFRKQE